MSPSSIFWTPLAEFQGRVPDPKQGMFRKSTECTLEPKQMKLINLGSPSTRGPCEMLRTLYLVFLQLWSYVLTIAFNCHVPDVEQLALTMISSLSQDACTYSLSFFHFAFKRSTPPAWWNFGDQSACLSWRQWNLSVIHLVPHSVVELSRIRLSVWNWYLLQLTFGGRGLQILSMESSHSIPGFMELKSYLGVNSKTEVVVHHVQGRSERSDLW